MFASQAALVIANARRHREEQRTRADLETLVDTAPVGVVVFDAKTGGLASVNREAIRIADGLREGGQAAADLLEVVTCVRGDGREFSLKDFTLAELLSAGETVRAEFLAMVSHELRTPLAAVKGSITTLLEAANDLDPAETAQFYRIIRDQSDQMRFLIGDLLDVARIETGALPVDPEPTEVRALVDEAVSRFVSGGAKNPVNVELAEDLPLALADRLRVVQVLGNLLSNAAGYSPDGSPIVVSAVRDGVHVAVSVSDHGRGIPAELLPELFRKFSRGQGADTASGVDGSGLGRAICKGIVEAHGGRIWAESDGPDHGARFTFTIPAVEAGSTRTTGSRSRRTARQRTRVLAVDDDPQALRYIRDSLSRAGYHPVVTGDPAEVPRLMEEERPHLVLMDLMLPDSDGISLMREILASTDVPVIFVSAYGQEELVIKALDMGAVDYVVKPFSPSELSARIRAAMRQRAGLDRAEQPRTYLLGDLSIDYAERRVTLAGRPVELTATEYAVLRELSAHGGMVLTHGQLLLRVWGVSHSGDSGLVRTIVTRLRGKLGDDAGQPRYIFTEPRVGYRMPKGEGEETAES